MYERRFPFVQVDVFTSVPLQGNQLAVFTDARGLKDAEMQALARETNLSETTFVFPRDPATERQHGIKVRIFTVAEELPFAGHPTLGTAFVLRGPDRRSAGVTGGIRVRAHENLLHLDLKVGKIPVEFSRRDGGQLFGEMTQPDPQFGNVLQAEDVAPCAGLSVEDIETRLPIQTVSTGIPFAIVPLKSVEALGRLNLNWQACEQYLARTDAKFLYFMTPGAEGETPHMRARMIFYHGEDPATGSAAGCCAAWMVKHGVARADEQVLIEQGVEMGRRSLIYVRAGKEKSTEGDRIVTVRVGGSVVEVMQGEVFL